MGLEDPLFKAPQVTCHQAVQSERVAAPHRLAFATPPHCHAPG